METSNMGNYTVGRMPKCIDSTPIFSVKKFALGDDDPDPFGQGVMVNPDLQIV
jgi:hypothetical protein